MADTMGTIAVVAALGAAGFGAYEYVNHQSKSAGTAPVPPPTATGYQPPSNLLGLMQSAYTLYGSPNGWGGRTQWVNAMNTAVAPVGAGPWSWVWDQWMPIANNGATWPSNSQLQGWLKYAVDNNLSG